MTRAGEHALQLDGLDEVPLGDVQGGGTAARGPPAGAC